MKMFRLTLIVALLMIGLHGLVAAQSSFSNPNVDYTFELPTNAWKMTATPSVTSPNVEYTNGDRMSGFLEVRRLTVKDDASIDDIIEAEEEKLKFMQGYVKVGSDPISGKLKGRAFNFEYIKTGRNMTGRFYFLRADPTTVYVLRFTGEKYKLLSVRPQTDSIARTFSVKS